MVRARRPSRGRGPQAWITGGLVVLAAGLVVAIATGHEIATWACALGLIAAVPWFLGRGRERKEARLQAQRAALHPEQPSVPRSGWAEALKLYFIAAMAFCVLGFAFANKAVLPVHVALVSGPPVDSVERWLTGGLFGGMLLFLVALLAGLLHQGTARAMTWLAGMLVTSGVFGLGLGLLLDGANVHFDTSAPRKATARVLLIKPVKYTSRTALPDLWLAEWRAARGPDVRTHYRSDAFHLDMDKHYATFYWREGFLGRPYAVAYPPGP